MEGEKNRRRARRKGGHPVCLATGKIRYRDAHDAGLALVSLRRRRSRIESSGRQHAASMLLRRELSLPSMTEWLAEVAALEPLRVSTGTTEVMREIRGEMPDARP